MAWQPPGTYLRDHELARVACVAHPELGREQMSLVSVDHERLHAASKRTCHGLGVRAQDDLTWVKPRIGFGQYFRNRTEHVLFAIKGDLAVRCHNISTVFEAPQGKHSEKPERFYEIVRQASPGPYGEVFQRNPRPDFVNFFETREVSR